MPSRVPTRRALVSALAALGLAVMLAMPAGAASHRDGPLIAQDPQADQNDLYAFVSTNDLGQKSLNIIASYFPLEEAADGPNYYKLADDVRYSISIENTAQNGVFTGQPDVSYQFRFHTRYRCTNTFITLGIGAGCDATTGFIRNDGSPFQNVLQRYQITQVNADGSSTGLTDGITTLVPPDNIGRTTALYNQGGNGDNPATSGAMTTGNLDTYTQQAIYTLPGGIKVFVGQRADSFYADLASTFDLLQLRPLIDPTRPVNTLQGYNVHDIAMQIPLSDLASAQCPNGECVMGIFTTSERRASTIRPLTKTEAQGGTASVTVPSATTSYEDEGVANASSPQNIGPWRQIGRMGNPLFNEILVGLDDKDHWNQSRVQDDQQFAHYALNPEPAVLFNAVLGTHMQTTNRTDLQALFIPDLLKVDTSTAPVPLMAGDPLDSLTQANCAGSAFSTLSVFGGDTVWSPFQNTCVPSGWPNGRRLTDDVVAIAVDALAGSSILPSGTGLAATQPVINHVFPFAATPNNGRNHQHAPQ